MRIIPLNIKLNDNYLIDIEFSNGEKSVFDMNPFLEKGAFRELKIIEKFKTGKIVDGAIQWCNLVDLSPDTLYILSKKQN